MMAIKVTNPVNPQKRKLNPSGVCAVLDGDANDVPREVMIKRSAIIVDLMVVTLLRGLNRVST